MVAVCHPTGNANSRAALIGLYDGNLLGRFTTSIAVFEGDLLDQLGAIGPFSEFRRRRFDPRLKRLTYCRPWLEIGRLMASRAGLDVITTHESGIFCIDAVYRSLDRCVARSISKSKPSAVYAFEDGGWATFKSARALGIPCFYDLPIGYWRAARRLLENEPKRWPEWAVTLTGLRDSDDKLARKDDELRMADRIFVASSFTKQTLGDYCGELAPIEVIPYGFPDVADVQHSQAADNRPLKLLFVGGLSQRKGVADLFAAVEAIGPRVALTVVGHKTSNDCRALDEALARHRWIPGLPHEEILKLMREHDVFVFPSLFEGFGLVITEAMSQGTPVITTDRTAGPDLIEHGRNGWLIEAGNTAALQAQIEELLEHPGQIASAGREAMETAKKRPWDVYGRELAEKVGAILREREKR